MVGEARSRSRELSSALLELIGHCIVALRKEMDPRMILCDAYGLSNIVANSIARHLEEHSIDSFQVPDPDRILVEQIISSGHPTYMITTCRGRGFNTALGYFLAGLAESNGISVIEMSFDENGLLLHCFARDRPGTCMTRLRVIIIEVMSVVINTGVPSKRFKEVAGRSLIIPMRIGAEISPQVLRQRPRMAQQTSNNPDSLLMRETGRDYVCRY